ncbi:RmlC-like cupin domain-containing protein [Lophiotrema nucula]|uniref:RmlC-like cupin domain-containing protein n=1 Tax=Lophiotrema nucula TaxID=690887 RepID=A0A6A5Z9L6_9PLEO|nr:RmlC-like cupin domain-containing protein [Lophiotrema nucula]
MGSVRSLLLFSLTPIWALPAPQAVESGVINPPGPPGATGSLRGSEALQGYNPSNDVPTEPSTVIPPEDFEIAPGQQEDADEGLYIDFTNVKNPQPIRGGTTGPTDPGPRTEAYDALNSDIYAPPASDAGDVDNAKWPFGLSHNRHGLAGAGWARQQNTGQLPVAKAMAGVNMRLEPNGYREMHWHSAGEWALMLNGSVRISAVNEDGQSFIDDVTAGDVWFFPAGIPHSIQAFDDGCEFLLVFDDGSFSEDGTALLSELMIRNPKSVVAKNFRTSTQALEKLPTDQLWIFPGTPAPTDISKQNTTGPAGVIPQQASYSFHWSEQKPYTVPGGTVKILDPRTFPVANTFAAALFTIEPGAMREMHWHTSSDEWTYFLAGKGRLTVYQAPASSRTFDFSAGDVGYVPVPNAHYIENVGNETLVYLEVLQAGVYNDISVNQWLGLTPRQIVKDTLHLDDDVLDNLPKVKPFIIPGNKDLTTTNFTGDPL